MGNVKVRLLCRLPYAGSLLSLVEVTLMERAALAAPDATPSPLKLLAAFRQSRGNHRGAAAALVAFALQLGSASSLTPPTPPLPRAAEVSGSGRSAADAERIAAAAERYDAAATALEQAATCLALLPSSQQWVDLHPFLGGGPLPEEFPEDAVPQVCARVCMFVCM
jgi:hypothetical protein